MQIGRLPIDEQVEHFRAALSRNRTLTEVLAITAGMELRGWYLVAGCLYQTVWNVATGQPPEAGILDYDLAYFDATDLSWEAEDAVIRAGSNAFGHLPRAGADPQPGPRPSVVRAEIRCALPCASVHGGGHRHLRGDDRLRGRPRYPGPELAHLRAARILRRVQPCRAA
jgi:Nucleotidyltransferase